MRSAILLEACKARGQTATLVVVDVYKAFDQICRPLVYTLMAKEGLPSGAIWAYSAFQEGLWVRNSVGEGLG
eukprot:10354824-Alexandrium_andersonii.AAC.1